jgi:hypothetical protein
MDVKLVEKGRHVGLLGELLDPLIQQRLQSFREIRRLHLRIENEPASTYTRTFRSAIFYHLSMHTVSHRQNKQFAGTGKRNAPGYGRLNERVHSQYLDRHNFLLQEADANFFTPSSKPSSKLIN